MFLFVYFPVEFNTLEAASLVLFEAVKQLYVGERVLKKVKGGALTMVIARAVAE